MMSGETLWSGAPGTCDGCGVKLKLQVCQSAAGFYVGTMCNCGPYSRETGYFPTSVAAGQALERLNAGDVSDLRT